MFDTLGSSLGDIVRLFSEVSVPFFPNMSFLDLYLGFLVWTAAVWLFWKFLGQLRGSGYASGKPKKASKTRKGGGD